MPPHSNSEMGREQTTKHNQDILEISENLQKINLETTKTEDEHCTYNIEELDVKDEEEEAHDDDSNTTDLDICATIKEKGPAKQDKNNNKRFIPYTRNSTSGGHFSYNNTDDNIANNIFEVNPHDPLINGVIAEHISSAEQQEFSLFNHTPFEKFQPLLYQNITNDTRDDVINESAVAGNNDYYPGDQYLQISDCSSTYEAPNYELFTMPNAPNIPATIDENLASNRAEQALSKHIDGNKKLKQIIWIMVNTKIEDELISTLRDKITSGRFTQIDLNYIYAIIFRLMKKESNVDGRRLLTNYFLSDVDILFQIAIKGHFLLMDFMLEVYQNLGIDLRPFDVLLHQIVDCSHVDLCEIIDGLLNKTFDNKPSLNMFNVNNADAAGETILMVVLRNISMNKGLFAVNMKYLDVILRRFPDITYMTQNRWNIFKDVINCQYKEEIVRKFLNYDYIIIDNIIFNPIYNEWDHLQNTY